MTPVILLPIPGTSPPAVTTAGHPTVLVTAPDPPPAAARLDVGSIVTGTVIGRDSQSLVAIRTDKGVLALQTNANLPVGSTVSMEVRVAGARLQMVVLSVEPPPGQAPQPLASAPAPLPTSGPPPTPATTLALALSGGNLVMATVVHATAGRPGTQPPLAPAALAAGQPIGAALPAAPLPHGRLPAPQLPFGHATAAGSPVAEAPVTGMPGSALSRPAAASALPAGQPTLQPAIAALLNSTAVLDAELATLVAGMPASARPGAAATPGAGAAAALLPVQGDGGPALPSAAPPAGAAPQLQPPVPQAPPQAAQPATVPQPQPAFPAGAEIGVRIVAASLPGEPIPAADPRPAGALPLTVATVVGQTPAGHPVVDSEAGRLVLAVKAPLPAGTALLIELPPQGLADGALPPQAGTPLQALTRLSQGWPALGAALATLGANGDVIAAQALTAKLPQAGPQLAAGLMTMLNQLAAGEAGEWLGAVVQQALERLGKRELVDRLQTELRQLSRLAVEPSGGDWRVMFLPLRHGDELHQMNLYIRGRRKGGDKGELDTGTRFIVEVDMTRLGPLQLDGLVHGRRFDLMLRSRAPLSPAMRRDIEAIFDEARGLSGFAGTIGFQVAQSFPVQPLEQAKRKSAAPGLVV